MKQDLISTIFGVTLANALRRSPLSTNGLDSYSTQALLGEIQRRIAKYEFFEDEETKSQAKSDVWMPIAEVVEKYFPGVDASVVATYLTLIGHPYRLDTKLDREDFSVRKIFMESRLPDASLSFARNSATTGETEHYCIMLHPLVGKFLRSKKAAKSRSFTGKEPKP